MSYLLINNGTLIKGNGEAPIPNAAVLIKDNCIVAVGREDSIEIPNEIIIVDVKGSFILPGFIDVHVHLMTEGFTREETIYTPLSLYFYNAIERMERTINAGITSVRDAGLADIGVKLAVDKGIIIGPRLQISISPLSITGGHFDFWLNSGFDIKPIYPGFPNGIADGKEEVRKKVREIMRAGAEVIKVMVTGGVISANDRPEYPQFSMKELEVIVEEAQYRDLQVVAHAHGTKGIKNALKAGINSIEHGTCLDDECIELMIANKTILVPTFLAMKVNKELAQDEKSAIPDWSRDDAIRMEKVHGNNIRKAYEAGVNIVMGTDSGVVTHGRNLEELGYMCDIGMDPMEAIIAGTKKAAESLGWEEKIGTIEIGKLADIVISKNDPLTNIKSLGNPNNILLVIKDGKIIKNLL
ncbi:MAG: amidohydrolase family protein [Methanobacterium sp.]|nr:amidohydrolase family protein [Methanobacterium sp.]